MPGQIILSNRLARMQQAAKDFGDTFEGLALQQRKQKLEDEDRVAEAKSRAIRDRASTTAADAADLQLGVLKRRDAARQEAEGFAGDLANFGQAVPDSAINVGGALPGFQAQTSPRPVMDNHAEALKDRLRAQWMNADARAKGETAAYTIDDVRKKREADALARDESVFDLGEKKNKAGRDASESAQRIKESKSQEARNYAEAAKTKSEAGNGLGAIPGLVPIDGITITKDSVKAVKDAYAKYTDFKTQLNQYQALIDKYGAEAFGEHADELDAYATGLQMTLKELNQLGVLNGPDLKLLEKQIPAAAGFKAKAKSMAYGAVVQDAISPRLHALEANMDSKFSAMARSNGFRLEKPGADTASQKAPSFDQFSDDDLDAQLRARGIDPATGKPLKGKGGASGAF